jgi:hypothetical protein
MLNQKLLVILFKRQNPDMCIRAADAMALAIIYSTYLQLVFDEEGHNVPDNIMDALEEKR